MIDDKKESINGKIFALKTINPESFKITGVESYSKHEGAGLAKQVKVAKVLKFRSISEVMSEDTCKKDGQIAFDPNMSICDFEKI